MDTSDYDDELIRDLGLGHYSNLSMGYYWPDGSTLKGYTHLGSVVLDEHSTNIPLPMVCSVLNVVAKEHFSSVDPHPLRWVCYKDGNQVWEPPYCFIVSGLGYRPLCVLRGAEYTLPAEAAEVLNLSVVDHLVLTSDTQWEAMKVLDYDIEVTLGAPLKKVNERVHTDVRLVRDGKFTISCGSLFVPTLDVVPNAPHFSFTIKGGNEEVVYQGTLEECFTSAKPDRLYRYDVGREQLLPNSLQ